MKETTNFLKSWWVAPWGYKESFAIVIGLAAVGTILQIVIGSFNFALIQYPVNIIVVIGIVLVTLWGTIKGNSLIFRWMSSVQLSVANITVILFYSIIMGFVPQVAKAIHSNSIVGFDAVTTAWAFVIVYFFTVVNLSFAIASRLLRFKLKDYAFYLNHLGLLVMMVALGFGAADFRRLTMYVDEGNTEWRVFNEHGGYLELPIAIKLNNFHMEEFVPKLAVINRETSYAIPHGNPRLWQIDSVRNTVTIGKWHIELEKYIHEAIGMNDTTFHAISMPGSCPAAFVRVTNTETGTIQKGWVTSGNFAQFFQTLELEDPYHVAMTRPEPSLFRSYIEVFTQDGRHKEVELEVNKPLRIGHWTIYQLSYDVERGKASTWSGFELVYDPWSLFVHWGLIIFVIGSVLLVFQGKKKKKNYDNMG